jgi:tetratricopeptide (TPR) repeat protein
MAIKGSLSEASLPDVIQLLTYSLKSGCLSVTDGKNFGNIFIKDGKIIYATILNRKQRIGDILVLKREIDNETLSRALEIQKKEKKKRLGEILVEIGAISKEILESELKNQIEQTIFTMLTWESGYFNFEADLLPSKEEHTVNLSPQELLLEGARQIDEWRKIENKLPPFESVLVPKGDAESVPLTEHEKKIIDLIDGSRSIDDTLKLSEFDFFETCRIIYGLLSAGLIEKPEKPREVKKATGDISEYKNLGFAFYKTEMFDEAKREYNKILEIDSNNAEALLFLGLIELTKNNHENAKEYFLKALETEKRFSVLNDLGYICIQLKLFDDAITYLNEALELEPENLKVKCNLGIALYNQGSFDEAGNFFKEVIEKSPEYVTPYIYLPIIYSKRDDTDSAINLLIDAIDKFPRSGFLKNNLAVLYECLDKHENAEKLYRQALEADPQNAVLCMNLADFYYETQILGAAKELYEKIPEEERDWQILFKLGNIYLRQGDSNQALNFWQKAKELNPEEEVITRNIELLQKSSGR